MKKISESRAAALRAGAFCLFYLKGVGIICWV